MNLTKSRRWIARLALALALGHAAGVARAQNLTQTLTLNPGWNSVFLEVAPTNSDIRAIFAGVPIDSVWAFAARPAAVDFIQDPNQLTGNLGLWQLYVPTNRLESINNNLFTLQANRAYLVKSTNAAAVTLTLTGRPSLRKVQWVPDSYNLRGFPIDPATPPTFQAFFAPSPAHYNPTTGALQKIWKLDSTGKWVMVAPGDAMQSGVAYWVFTQGASDYLAPLTVVLDAGDGLDYSREINTLNLTLFNRAGQSRSALVTDASAPAASPLSYAVLDVVNGPTWPALPSPLVRLEAAGASEKLRLAIRREAFSVATYTTVLTITDGAGTRLRVPVSADKVLGAGASAGSIKSGPRVGGTPAAEASAHAGLWVGTATITNVSEVHSGALVTNLYAYRKNASGVEVPLAINDPSIGVWTNPQPSRITVVQTNGSLVLITNLAPITNLVVLATNKADGKALAVRTRIERAPASATTTPTASGYRLRLLLHVDTNGVTRLLKEVIQEWKDGTTTNNAQGFAVTATPGRNVLVTDPVVIGQFKGAVARDGISVGRRLSTAAFDFAGNELALSGYFALGSAVRGTNVVGATLPTNPFLHKYHPDHDNLDAQYVGTAQPPEVYDVTRAIAFEFSPADTNAPPGYGYNRVSGVYRETISGLHKADLAVDGSFNLTRVATTGVLNK